MNTVEYMWDSWADNDPIDDRMRKVDKKIWTGGHDPRDVGKMVRVRASPLQNCLISRLYWRNTL